MKTTEPRPWQVRCATVDDLDALAGFSAGIAEETEGRILSVPRTKAALETVIRDASRGQMFVACDGPERIGCFMVNGREWSEWRNGFILWLTGTYVRPDYRRRGVRRALYQFARSWAMAQPSVVGFRAYVQPTNQAILKAETSSGMRETGYRVIEDLFDPIRPVVER